MKRWAMACVLITMGALSGCHKKAAEAVASDAALTTAAADTPDDQPGFLGLGSKHGRYAAVGIYQPGDGWTKVIADQQTPGAQAAQQVLDQAVIVVADSQTGEVRACGDMTGYCVGINPWKAKLTAAQIAPIRLTNAAKPAVERASSAGSASLGGR